MDEVTRSAHGRQVRGREAWELRRSCDTATFEDCVQQAEICCEQARLATRQRRFKAAGGLFSTAGALYKRALLLEGVPYLPLEARLSEIEREIAALSARSKIADCSTTSTSTAQVAQDAARTPVCSGTLTATVRLEAPPPAPRLPASLALESGPQVLTTNTRPEYLSTCRERPSRLTSPH